jgi:hypothetical protein
MSYRHRFGWLACIVLSLSSVGCCCVQGGPGSGACGLGRMAACNSGCGEVYVDEWFSHPPTVDPCCGSVCSDGGCRPVRTVLSLLWGTRYVGDCGCDSCGGGGFASGGCSSCGSGGDGYVTHAGFSDVGHGSHGSSCNCGGGAIIHSGGAHGGEMLAPTPAHPMASSVHGKAAPRTAQHVGQRAPSRQVQPAAHQGATHSHAVRPASHSTGQPPKSSPSAQRINPAMQKLDAARAQSSR